MEYIILLIAVAALISPLFVIYKRRQSGKNVRGGLIANIACFFALCIILTFAFGLTNSALAADAEAQAAASNGLATGLGYISAALAVGLSCIGGGIAVASGASAALGALSENEKVFGKALIFVGLAEGVALYGLLVALMIISRL